MRRGLEGRLGRMKQETSGVEDSLFVIEACRLIIKGELPKAEALAEREADGRA